jgi:excisionase family DNA binding protein
MTVSVRKAHSIPETVAITGISRSKLYLEIKAGNLKTVKLGKRRLVRPEALDEWLAANEH